MENSLAVRSIDDLIDLESKDLRPVLKKVADVLYSLETRIARISELKRKREATYTIDGRYTSIDKLGVIGYWIYSFICAIIGCFVLVFCGLLLYHIDDIKSTSDTSVESIFIPMLPILITITVLLSVTLAFLFTKLAQIASKKRKMLSNQEEEIKNDKDFEVEFNNSIELLSVIPEKYRISLILNRFLEYLQDGEARSWADCIEKFKTDNFREEQAEQFSSIISNLEAIKANTRATAIFSGITAWNTGSINAKLSW